MTEKKFIDKIKKYRNMTGEERREFLVAFEEKMIYRTTKTENPSLTLKVVKQVLNKLKKSHA